MYYYFCTYLWASYCKNVFDCLYFGLNMCTFCLMTDVLWVVICQRMDWALMRKMGTVPTPARKTWAIQKTKRYYTFTQTDITTSQQNSWSFLAYRIQHKLWQHLWLFLPLPQEIISTHLLVRVNSKHEQKIVYTNPPTMEVYEAGQCTGINTEIHTQCFESMNIMHQIIVTKLHTGLSKVDKLCWITHL